MSNKKKTKVITTMTEGAKRKANQKSITKTNLEQSEKSIKAATLPRETKYVYPKGCKTAEEKKDFRRKARATARSLEKKMNLIQAGEIKLSGAEKKELKETLKEFQQKTYTHPA